MHQRKELLVFAVDSPCATEYHSRSYSNLCKLSNEREHRIRTITLKTSKNSISSKMHEIYTVGRLWFYMNLGEIIIPFGVSMWKL